MADLARLVSKHALAAPGANTDAFTAVTPHATASTLRLTISLATTSIVDLRITDGTTAYSIALNAAVALVASQLYVFSFGCGIGLTYSIRVRTDSVIQTLFLDEVRGGALTGTAQGV